VTETGGKGQPEGFKWGAAGYFTGMLGVPIVLVFYGLTVLFGRNAGPVLGVGLVALLLGAFVSDALLWLFHKAGITESGRLGLALPIAYSNAVNSAVGKPPAVTAREFVLQFGVLPAGPDEMPWYEVDYPEDTELRDSFRLFAEGGELADEYADAGCASARSPECANLILENLDAWATWYETNH